VSLTRVSVLFFKDSWPVTEILDPPDFRAPLTTHEELTASLPFVLVSSGSVLLATKQDEPTILPFELNSMRQMSVSSALSP